MKKKVTQGVVIDIECGGYDKGNKQGEQLKRDDGAWNETGV